MGKEQNKISSELMKLRGNLGLHQKIKLTEARIHDFCEANNENVYIAFSGGKDSTVLLDIIRSLYYDIPAVFVNTGLEYPDIKNFVSKFENIITIKPKMSFKKVIENYGYPVISKEVAGYIESIRKTKSLKTLKTRTGKDVGKLPNKWYYLLDAPFKISNKCCDILKKNPFKEYEKNTGRKPFVGIMASESIKRKQSYLQHGCNMYDGKKIMSRPLMFWKESDIWEFIKRYKIKIADVYTKGIKRTGCCYCGFGAHIDEINRYLFLKKYYPKYYNLCINHLGFGKVLDYIGIKYC